MENKNEAVPVEQNAQATNSFPSFQTELMEESSQELKDYILRLYTEGKKQNPKSVCGKCWNFITREQKEKHEPKHLKEIVLQQNTTHLKPLLNFLLIMEKLLKKMEKNIIKSSGKSPQLPPK